MSELYEELLRKRKQITKNYGKETAELVINVGELFAREQEIQKRIITAKHEKQIKEKKMPI